MSTDQQYCLRWNDYPEFLLSVLDELQRDETFVDVTLACEGQQVKAHRLVLSACSPFFKDLLKCNPCQHPIIVLHQITLSHLCSLLEFVYRGRANIPQDDLGPFLMTADALQISGLAKVIRSKEWNDPNEKKNDSSSPADTIKDVEESEQNCKKDRLPPDDSCQEIDAYKDNCQDSQMESETNVSANSLRNEAEACEFSCKKSRLSADTNNQQDQLIKDEVDNDMTSFPNVEQPSHVDNLSHSLPSSVEGKEDLDFSKHYNPDINCSSTDNMSVQCLRVSAEPRRPHCLDPRPCPVCGRMYSNQSNLRQHMRLIHQNHHVGCPVCQKTFRSTLYLRRHMLGVHMVTRPMGAEYGATTTTTTTSTTVEEYQHLGTSQSTFGQQELLPSLCQLNSIRKQEG